MFESVPNVVIYGFYLFVIIRLFAYYRRNISNSTKNKNIAFLHPYCNGCGGGERVLWDAIGYLMEQRDKLKFNKIVIYSAKQKKLTLSNVLKTVKTKVGITISKKNQKYLLFVPLSSHWIIEPKYHPFATLLLQSLSAIILAIEGLFKFTPHVFIDTTGNLYCVQGFAFTLYIIHIMMCCA